MESGSVGLLVLIAGVSFGLAYIGAAIGLVLGHLRLPLLIAYLGAPGAGAMTNLLVSGTGALSGAVGHLRAGRVSWAAVALMGIPSVIGAVIAVLIFVQVNPFWSYFAIGAILVISGLKMARRPDPNLPPAAPLSLRRRIAVEIVLGLGLGALAAVTGLMLGSLRLPVMVRYLRMDPKEAVGTNMAVGCLTALVGAATGLIAGTGRLDWLVMAVVIPPTILGGLLGVRLTGRLSKEAVQRLAGRIVAATGVILLGQGVTLVVRTRPTEPPAFLVDEDEFDGWFDFDLPDANEMPDRAPPDEDQREDNDEEPADPPPTGPSDGHRPR